MGLIWESDSPPSDEAGGIASCADALPDDAACPDGCDVVGCTDACGFGAIGGGGVRTRRGGAGGFGTPEDDDDAPPIMAIGKSTDAISAGATRSCTVRRVPQPPTIQYLPEP